MTETEARQRATEFLDSEDEIREQIRTWLRETRDETPSEADLDQIEAHVHRELKGFYETEFTNIRVIAEG